MPPIYLAGLFDASGRIYPNALAVCTRDDAVKAALKRTLGGTIEPSRWVLKSAAKRRKLYSSWAAHTRYRRAEIEAALDNLGAS